MWGFWGFLALALLVLIYLIRPRPKDYTVPSLMFLMKDKGVQKQSTFFKKFVNNLLFILQCIALALLAFALTMPFIGIQYDSSAGNTVIVLDVSASMQTFEGTSTRFDKAVSLAKDNLKGDSSVILVENRPVLVLESKSEDKALGLLTTLKPKETRSNIGDSILHAGDILKGKEGRVIVISDFAHTEGADPYVAKRTIESKGVVVDFVKVGSEDVSNSGIVDLRVDHKESKVFLKNYDDKEQTITVEVNYEDGESKKVARTIMPKSIENVLFESKGGVTKIEILYKDDLMVDNTAYISNPQKTKMKALLITNNNNFFIKNALLASGTIDVDVAEPPVVPSVDYDIIVLGDFDHKKILPGTIGDIKEKVADGSALIITFNDVMDKLSYEGLLPVTLKGLVNETAQLTKSIENQFTKDVVFGAVDFYYPSEPVNNDTIVIAKAEDSPVIAMKEHGDGKIIYYGIKDKSHGFKNSPSYPIFWTEAANFMLGIEDLNNFNFKTGKVLTYNNEKKITGPMGTIKASKVILDKTGVYETDGIKFAVNILSDEESDIGFTSEVDAEASDTYIAEKVKRKKDVNLEAYLIVIVSILLFIELIYIKFRGDL